MGRTGLPVIRSVITIVGNGSTIRRSGGAPQFRIFAVAGVGNLELQRTTVSGGVATTSEGGGGAYIRRGVLTLANSTMSGNSAGLPNIGYSDGGGISNTFGDVILTNSNISGNTASHRGGGIAQLVVPLLSLTERVLGTSLDGSGKR